MNYQELLKKYMNQVGESEGVDYADHCDRPPFTEEETAELARIHDEIISEQNNKNAQS